MNIASSAIINECVFGRKSYNEMKEYISKFILSIEELDEIMDNIFRTPTQSYHKEYAALFIIIYDLFKVKSQVPLYPDPFEGMVRKKIKNLPEFIEKYSNSIFGFVSEIPGIK